MKTLRSRSTDGDDFAILEPNDLKLWGEAVVGRITLRVGIGAIIVIATAAVMWTRLVTRVEAGETRINSIDLTGTQSERRLERRLERIEWALEGLPDSIAVRLLKGR